MTQTAFTVREAALALGVHKRTIQRRIDDGALSATLAQRGKQQVRVIDGAELARFAEANGYTLSLEAGDPGAQAAQVTGATERNLPVANGDRGAPFAPNGAATVCPTCEGLRLALDARGELVAALKGEVAFLREQVALLTTRALPPAPVSELTPAAPERGQRQTWWQRLTGKPETGGG